MKRVAISLTRLIASGPPSNRNRQPPQNNEKARSQFSLLCGAQGLKKQEFDAPGTWTRMESIRAGANYKNSKIVPRVFIIRTTEGKSFVVPKLHFQSKYAAMMM
jgi:hypothetical protein